MSQNKIRLLEDRVLNAVAQVRTLKVERDRAEGGLRELRRRLEELESELERLRGGLPRDEFGQFRNVLAEAVRDLRGDDGPGAARRHGESEE
ncbi:MAG: hypothetical protein LAO51_11880 [Acidobacteriia bacterium]|nr:hypothetical protein [Terriglobia bacterium]